MATAYQFTTIWKVYAPVEDVWNVIFQTADWPKWWDGVISVTKVKQGDEQDIGTAYKYCWTSALPYKLEFVLETTLLEYGRRMEGRSYGELEGTGIWSFDEKSDHILVKNFWKVSTTRWWMNLLSFVMKPVFSYNHKLSMDKGAAGLGKWLNCKVEILKK